eukprot:SAG31_NODE_1020_length_10349_cov_5.621561_14_plen_148_part_00
MPDNATCRLHPTEQPRFPKEGNQVTPQIPQHLPALGVGLSVQLLEVDAVAPAVAAAAAGQHVAQLIRHTAGFPLLLARRAAASAHARRLDGAPISAQCMAQIRVCTEYRPDQPAVFQIDKSRPARTFQASQNQWRDGHLSCHPITSL